MKTLELVTFDLVSWMHVADEVDDGDEVEEVDEIDEVLLSDLIHLFLG